MTHKWDYDHPSSSWERMPWFVRWPLAVLLIAVGVFLFTAPLHPWMPAP